MPPTSAWRVRISGAAREGGVHQLDAEAPLDIVVQGEEWTVEAVYDALLTAMDRTSAFSLETGLTATLTAKFVPQAGEPLVASLLCYCMDEEAHVDAGPNPYDFTLPGANRVPDHG